MQVSLGVRPEGTLKAPTLVQGMLMLTALATLASAAVAIATAKGRIANWNVTKGMAIGTGVVALATAGAAGRNWHVEKKASRDTELNGGRRPDTGRSTSTSAADEPRQAIVIDPATMAQPKILAEILVLLQRSIGVQAHDYQGTAAGQPATVEGSPAENGGQLWGAMVDYCNNAPRQSNQILIRDASDRGYFLVESVNAQQEIVASWGAPGQKVQQVFTARSSARVVIC